MTPPIHQAIARVCRPVPPPANPGGLPYPTHSGILTLAGIELKVHRLSTGQAIIEQESMKKFMEALGMAAEDMRAFGMEGKP